MAFWTAIKTFFTIAPKAADDILDKDNGLLVRAGGWVNDLQYTEAEKARDFGEMAKCVVEYVKTTLGESTERSATRRAIAILWIKAQLGLVFMTAIAIPADIILGASIEGYKGMIMTAEFFALTICNVMVWGTGSVIVFFFGPYMWGAHIAKKNGEPPKP